MRRRGRSLAVLPRRRAARPGCVGGPFTRGRGIRAGGCPGGTHQAQHDPYGLIVCGRDRRAQPYLSSTLAGSRPTTSTPPGIGAGHLHHAEHDVGLHAVSVK
jgi:hypothetical protein